MVDVKNYPRTPPKIRVFKTKAFSRDAKKADLEDDNLLKAVEEIERGMYEADLGTCVIKKRIAINGRGKSGGIRTIACYKEKEKIFFVELFKKNDKSDLTPKERSQNQMLSKFYFKLNDKQISFALKEGELEEILW